MSIATEVTRLTTLRNNIRSKLITLGIISDSSADLQDCYEGIYQVPGRTYADTDRVNGVTTIPSGYYDEPLEIDSFGRTKYYLTGSSAPTSSIGSDGDLYLQTSGNSTWLERDGEFISTVFSQSFSLASTDYNTWTPSITAKSIKAAVNGSTFDADMANYEYLLRWRTYFKAVYPSGTTLKAAPKDQSCEVLQAIYRFSSTITNVHSSIRDTNYCSTIATSGLLDYYNSSSNETALYGTSYGFYPSATAATFSSTTSNTPTVTTKTPAFYARCHNTYFSTSIGSVIDKTNSKFIIIGDAFRLPIGSLRQLMYVDLADLHNNPPSLS